MNKEITFNGLVYVCGATGFANYHRAELYQKYLNGKATQKEKDELFTEV